MEEDVDALLLRRVAAGHRRAFGELYERNAGWLAVRLRRRCPDPELAAELLQETFLVIWRSAGGYRGGPDRRRRLHPSRSQAPRPLQVSRARIRRRNAHRSRRDRTARSGRHAAVRPAP